MIYFCIHQNSFYIFTNPLFGPLGTTNGNAIPTPPHKTVNTMKGIAANPIAMQKS